MDYFIYLYAEIKNIIQIFAVAVELEIILII